MEATIRPLDPLELFSPMRISSTRLPLATKLPAYGYTITSSTYAAGTFLNCVPCCHDPAFYDDATVSDDTSCDDTGFRSDASFYDGTASCDDAAHCDGTAFRDATYTASASILCRRPSTWPLCAASILRYGYMKI